MKTIYCIIDMENAEFHFFEKWKEAKREQKEFGTITYKPAPNLPEATVPKYDIKKIKLKHYYGTVWYIYKKKESGAMYYEIKGRKKDLQDKIKKGWILKKYVFETYEEYTQKDDEGEEEKNDVPRGLLL